MPKRSSTRSARSITSITYWRKFASHRIIYVGLAIVFGLGIVAYFGAAPSSLGRGQGGADGSAAGTIATVDGTPISRADFDRRWEMARRQVVTQGPMVEASAQGEILAGLVDMALIQNAAKAKGVSVTDEDIDRQIAELRKQMTVGNSAPTDDELAARLGLQTMDEVRDQLRTGLLPKLLGEVLSGSARLTMDDLLKTYDEAKVRQILVAVNTSPAHPERSLPDEQARARAEKILAEVKAGKPFDQLANQFTDDPDNTPRRWDSKLKKMAPSGAPRGGDIGWVKREGSPLDPAVVSAIFALKPGEVSPIVKSPLGYHILKVEQVRRTLPKDFEKEKANLLDQLKSNRAADAVRKLVETSLKTAKIVWKDPGYEWKYLYAKVSPSGSMGFMGMADPKDQEELLQKLAAYCPSHTQDSTAALVRGNLLYQKYMLSGITIPGQPGGPKLSQAERDKLRDEAIKSFEQGLLRGEDRTTRMILARMYIEMKQPEKALNHYKALQNALKWDDKADTRPLRQQLVQAFLQLNHPELAAIETQKLAEIDKREAEDAARKKEYEAKARAAAAATLPKKAPTAATTPPNAPKPAAPAAGAGKPAASAPASPAPK